MDSLERLFKLSKATVLAFKERRKHPRTSGRMKEIEDTTYSVLRRYDKLPKTKTASIDKGEMVSFPAKARGRMKDYGSHFDNMWSRYSSTRPELNEVKEMASDREKERYASPRKKAKVTPINKKPTKVASMDAFDELESIAKANVGAILGSICRKKYGAHKCGEWAAEGRKRKKEHKPKSSKLGGGERSAKLGRKISSEYKKKAITKGWQRQCPQCKAKLEKPDLKTQSTCPTCGWKWGETSKAMSHTITPQVKKLPPGVAQGAEFSGTVRSKSRPWDRGKVSRKPSLGEQESRMKSAHDDDCGCEKCMNKGIKEIKVKVKIKADGKGKVEKTEKGYRPSWRREETIKQWEETPEGKETTAKNNEWIKKQPKPSDKTQKAINRFKIGPSSFAHTEDSSSNWMDRGYHPKPKNKLATQKPVSPVKYKKIKPIRPPIEEEEDWQEPDTRQYDPKAPTWDMDES